VVIRTALNTLTTVDHRTILAMSSRLKMMPSSSEHRLLDHSFLQTPFPERITFRLAVLAYRYQHGLAPSYLSNEIQGVADVDSRQLLRSAATTELLVSTDEALDSW
jgi:hypothetical protein